MKTKIAITKTFGSFDIELKVSETSCFERRIFSFPRFGASRVPSVAREIATNRRRTALERLFGARTVFVPVTPQALPIVVKQRRFRVVHGRKRRHTVERCRTFVAAQRQRVLAVGTVDSRRGCFGRSERRRTATRRRFRRRHGEARVLRLLRIGSVAAAQRPLRFFRLKVQPEQTVGIDPRFVDAQRRHIGRAFDRFRVVLRTHAERGTCRIRHSKAHHFARLHHQHLRRERAHRAAVANLEKVRVIRQQIGAVR
mmetsp:Transcript_16561/g.28513  ORF Transcript_16561/g.28513 Transcript_16561/m.28513 type:complete len:255 (+) Transcript_16561:946-1710(+)